MDADTTVMQMASEEDTDWLAEWLTALGEALRRTHPTTRRRTDEPGGRGATGSGADRGHGHGRQDGVQVRRLIKGADKLVTAAVALLQL